MAILLFGLGIRILHLSPHGEGIRKSFRVRYLSTWLLHSLQIANAWHPQTVADLEPVSKWLLWKSGRHVTYEEPAPSWWRSIPDDTSFETLPTFQDSVCPRCTCVHSGTGRLEGFTISASTLDQLYGSQFGRTRFLGAALWFLLFLDAFHSYDWPRVNNHSTCFGRLCKFLYYTLHTAIYSHRPVDCLSAVSRHRTRQIYPYAVIDHDCGRLRCSSPGLYLETEVGYGRLDDLLYPRNPGIFLFLTTLLVLENGRFFLGTNSCGSWRVWEEDYRPCMYCVSRLLQW